jgi:hypothetical protein
VKVDVDRHWNEARLAFLEVTISVFLSAYFYQISMRRPSGLLEGIADALVAFVFALAMTIVIFLFFRGKKVRSRVLGAIDWVLGGQQ